MTLQDLSPLAVAARQLVIHLARGADPAYVESACNELITRNSNGFGGLDVEVAKVAVEVMRGALLGVVELRSPSISAATRGVSRTGPVGPTGDAGRLSISERACRQVRDSDHASVSEYSSALEGAAPALHMTTSQPHAMVDRTPVPPTPPTPPAPPDGAQGQAGAA